MHDKANVSSNILVSGGGGDCKIHVLDCGRCAPTPATSTVAYIYLLVAIVQQILGLESARCLPYDYADDNAGNAGQSGGVGDRILERHAAELGPRGRHLLSVRHSQLSHSSTVQVSHERHTQRGLPTNDLYLLTASYDNRAFHQRIFIFLFHLSVLWSPLLPKHI